MMMIRKLILGVALVVSGFTLSQPALVSVGFERIIDTLSNEVTRDD